jgi:hypothetical protein
MRNSLLAAGLLAGSLLAAAPARAQVVTNGKAFQATPYAGYMIFGHLADGLLGTSLASANGPLYGAQLAVKLAPSVALVGNVGYANGDVKAGIPFLGGISVAKSSMLLYDAGLQLDIPTAGLALRPFVQAGAGAMHYSITRSALSTSSTNFAANVGLGADIPLGGAAAIRLMAKDYIGKFDFKDATGFDASGSRSNNFAITAGVRLDF